MKHAFAFLASTLLVLSPLGFGATLRVPKDKPIIQAAIDAARDGDTVQVAPGTYREKLVIGGKNITLASDFLETNDPRTIAATVLLGGSADGKKGSGAILSIEKGVQIATRVIGFTFQQGDHGVLTRGRVQVLNNRFLENRDAVSFESGGGIVRGNHFERNRDDGIDMDGASEALIEDNVIRESRDDGIEIRLHNVSGMGPMEIIIRGNTLTANGGDGVQLIDYPGKSPRRFRIERNLFTKNAMAAIGSMADGLTRENFQGAELIEPVLILNNTIADSRFGLTGGENMVVLNNVFVRIAETGLKRVHGDSAAGRNLLWQVGRPFDDCDLDQDAFLVRDPLLDAQYRPRPGSPCIDGGVAVFAYNGQELKLASDTFAGPAPDLGAFETKPAAR